MVALRGLSDFGRGGRVSASPADHPPPTRHTASRPLIQQPAAPRARLRPDRHQHHARPPHPPPLPMPIPARPTIPRPLHSQTPTPRAPGARRQTLPAQARVQPRQRRRLTRIPPPPPALTGNARNAHPGSLQLMDAKDLASRQPSIALPPRLPRSQNRQRLRARRRLAQQVLPAALVTATLPRNVRQTMITGAEPLNLGSECFALACGYGHATHVPR